MGKGRTKFDLAYTISFFVFFAMLTSSVVFAEDLYYCFRLEGLRMSCAGGIEGPPITSPPITNPPPCTQTCETTPQQCGPTTICRGRAEEKICPGSGIQPDCSGKPSYCRVVISSDTEAISGSAQCTYQTGVRHICYAPIKGNGEGCTCNGVCTANGSSCGYSGDTTCNTKCTCGPGTDEIITTTKYWCIAGGTRACNNYQENAPMVNDGQCGCKCPPANGNTSTPKCGTANPCPPETPPKCTP